MTLEQLKAFVAVARAGSFTRAADRLDTQKAHLSRVVAQLERKLGVQLIERTTRSLRVTEIGREVLERAQGILGAVEETERVAARTRGEPSGLLRVTCGNEFGMLVVSGWIDAVLTAHPALAIDADFTSRVVDLVHEGYDVAIRVGALDDSRLAARRLGELRYGLFACPRYLARRGSPSGIEDLARHDLVVFSGGTQRGGWRLLRGDEQRRVPTSPRLLVNNSFAVRDALLKSLGIGQLPMIVAGDLVAKRRLVRVLPEWEPLPVPVHAVFPSSRYLTPKVRAFVDHAVAHFPA